MHDAATSLGKDAVGIELPEIPLECLTTYPHAADRARPGADVFTLLRKEQAQLQKANDQIQICAEHYNLVREKFGKPPVAGDGLPSVMLKR